MLPFAPAPESNSKFSGVLPDVARLLSLITVLGLILCASCCNTFAQDDTDIGDVVRLNTDLLVFPLRVRNKEGQAATGLTLNDFSVSDEDKVTKNLSLSSGSDTVALLFALDQSGSLRDIIKQQRDAAIALFEKFGERSKVAVIRFADTPELIVPFDHDSAVARGAFDFPVERNSHTAIFDAASRAVSSFQSRPPSRSERRIVILISDGLDNTSRIKPSTVIDDANENRVSFYVIHLPLYEPREGHLMVRPPTKGFRELAEMTGGKYFLATNPGGPFNTESYDLTSVFAAIEEDLKSQYLLGVYLNDSARDGRKHIFSVNVLPQGLKYSIGRAKYSRSQKFFVDLPKSTEPQ